MDDDLAAFGVLFAHASVWSYFLFVGAEAWRLPRAGFLFPQKERSRRHSAGTTIVAGNPICPMPLPTDRQDQTQKHIRDGLADAPAGYYLGRAKMKGSVALRLVLA